MDAKQGIEMVKLISPKLTIPIHFDDYDAFLVCRTCALVNPCHEYSRWFTICVALDYAFALRD